MPDILYEEFSADLAFDKASKFDEESLTIRGVKLSGSKSVNGRTYFPQAMGDLRTLSEGAVVFSDGHPPKGTHHGNLTEIADIANVTGDDRENRGDMTILEEHPQGRLLFRILQKNPGSYALSHEVTDHDSSGPRTDLKVKRCKKLRGYGIVREGGTNKGIFEEITVSDDIRSVDALKKEYPDYTGSILEEGKKLGAADAKKGFDAEKAELVSDLAKLRKEKETLQESVDAFNAIEEAETRKKDILARAKKLADKHDKACDVDDDLLEALVPLDDDKVDIILDKQLTERFSDPPKEKTPISKSGTHQVATKSIRRRFGL